MHGPICVVLGILQYVVLCVHGPICVVLGILQYVVHWYIILRHILMYTHVNCIYSQPLHKAGS